MTLAGSPELILAFEEGGTLRVFDCAATAVLEYEGIDVEGGTVRFYNRRGTYLDPTFAKPNTSGKVFGVISWVSSGVYELAPSADSTRDSLALALSHTASLEPNPWFASLAQLKSVLSNEGVVVELAQGSN